MLSLRLYLFHFLSFAAVIDQCTGQWFAWPQQPLQKNEDKAYKNPLNDKNFENFIQDILTEFHTPGTSIAVVHKNETWAKGYGYSHLDPKTKATPRTLYYAGSTTKSFTAASAAKLVYSDSFAYKDIDWSTTLASLIRDDFVLQDEYAMNHITLLDALSHRTGMPRHDFSWMNGFSSVREVVRRMRFLPPHRELRVEWEYCNLMFIAVGHALETLTGIDLGKIFRTWFWEPLGMNETFFGIGEALDLEEKTNGEVKMSRGYIWNNATQDYVQVPFTDIPPSNGAGSVITNVLDYSRWIRQFLSPSNSTAAPLNASIVHDMTRAHMPIPLEPPLPWKTHSYGLGLETSTYRGQLLVGHAGAIAGYMAHMMWLPELEWGFVVLQNSYSLAFYAVTFRLIDDFLDSLGLPGERTNAAKDLRQIEKEAGKRLANGRKEVFPGAPDLAPVGPARELQAYEGTYWHPAYQNITISAANSSVTQEDSATTSFANGPSLKLYGTPSQRSYLNMSWIFHHVSGENWWVEWKMGLEFADVSRSQFDVGVDGEVKRLGLQAETAMDELAWFERIE